MTILSHAPPLAGTSYQEAETMRYEVDGTVFTTARGEQYVRVWCATLGEAATTAQALRAQGEAHISVWEHDAVREAREGGRYEPRLVG